MLKEQTKNACRFRVKCPLILSDFNHNWNVPKSYGKTPQLTVISRPKAGIVKSEEMSIARQLLGKHIPAATNTQATIE
jgi:hypothetical protein